MYYQTVVSTLCSPLTDLYIFIFSFFNLFNFLTEFTWSSIPFFFLLSSLAHKEHHAFEGWCGKHWVHCMPRSFVVIWSFELVWTRRRMVEVLQKCYMGLALLSFWHFTLAYCYWKWKNPEQLPWPLNTWFIASVELVFLVLSCFSKKIFWPLVCSPWLYLFPFLKDSWPLLLCCT